MESSLRDILTAVREGRLDPTEAARRLADPLERAGIGGETASGDTSSGDTALETAPVASDDTSSGDAAPDAATADAAPSAAAWADAVDDPAPHREDATDPAPRVEPSVVPPEHPQHPQQPEHPEHPEGTEVVGRAGDAPATTDLRLRAMTRRVRVIADPGVSTVSVDGPHELRREGTTLILESDRDLPFGDPFAFIPAMRGGFRLHPGDGKGFSLGGDLVVRLNPAIALDVDVTAGSLSVRGVKRVRARVTAGSARIEEMAGPLDLHVIGGTAKVDMRARGSENRIRCESGSINLRLRKDSDVRLRPDAQLGRIVIDGAEGGREIVVGAGSGRLDVEIVMGNLQVEVERE